MARVDVPPLSAPANSGRQGRSRSLGQSLHEARIDVERLSIHTPDLDDVFLAVTGSHVTGQADERLGEITERDASASFAAASTERRGRRRRGARRYR